MAWEERNGKTYYYRKRRTQGHVVSEYVGRDDQAILIARLDALAQDDAAAEHVRWAAERELLARSDAAACEFMMTVQLVLRGVLLLNGYHRHKRQWRRRRGRSGA